MEGIIVVATQVESTVLGGVCLIGASTLCLIWVAIFIYQSGMDSMKEWGFLFLTLVILFGTMAIGIYYTCKKPVEIQKVLIEDSVKFNDFMDYYNIKGQEDNLWIVVPKE